MKAAWKLKIEAPTADCFGTFASVTQERDGYILHYFSVPDPRPDAIKAMRALVKAANKKP